MKSPNNTDHLESEDSESYSGVVAYAVSSDRDKLVHGRECRTHSDQSLEFFRTSNGSTLVACCDCTRTPPKSPMR